MKSPGLLGFLVSKVGGAIVGFAVIMAIMVAVIGGASTASFARSASKALGTGFGVTIGSIPAFVKALQDGQKSVAPAESKTTKGQG